MMLHTGGTTKMSAAASAAVTATFVPRYCRLKNFPIDLKEFNHTYSLLPHPTPPQNNKIKIVKRYLDRVGALNCRSRLFNVG